MRKSVNFCDYFVICSATSDRRIRAIASSIADELAKYGVNASYRPGFESLTWLLVDTGDVVVHIFETNAREFYGLEHLWQAAPRINWKNKSR